ncbi:MAG: hypothetical protein HDS92_02410 [Bacteroidales bacterium]|nr:hypothetical protein [Bacteroidales bacterium]
MEQTITPTPDTAFVSESTILPAPEAAAAVPEAEPESEAPEAAAEAPEPDPAPKAAAAPEPASPASTRAPESPAATEPSGPTLAEMLRQAEERGYLRGRNDVITEQLTAPTLLQEPPSQPTVTILGSIRPSVWD